MAGSSSTTGKKSTMKQTAGKAATIKSPAKPAKKAVKRPSRRQTGPNEWVMLYLGGSAIGEIGVFPSGRKRTINYSVGPAAVAKEKKSAGKDVAADTENNESAGVVAETIPASANTPRT